VNLSKEGVAFFSVDINSKRTHNMCGDWDESPSVSIWVFDPNSLSLFLFFRNKPVYVYLLHRNESGTSSIQEILLILLAGLSSPFGIGERLIGVINNSVTKWTRWKGAPHAWLLRTYVEQSRVPVLSTLIGWQDEQP